MLIAVGKVRIDLAFLGAEIALDIAVSALTGGVGGVVSFVAKRVSITATRITIRAAHASARAAARIDRPGWLETFRSRIIDEEELGDNATNAKKMIYYSYDRGHSIAYHVLYYISQ